MVKRKRTHRYERQPLLPLNESYKEMNLRDKAREMNKPEQLELLPSQQQKLF